MIKGGGGGANVLPLFFLEGANIHHYAFVKGAIILPCQLLWGQMSTHAIFHRGADVRGGKCPGFEPTTSGSDSRPSTYWAIGAVSDIVYKDKC